MGHRLGSWNVFLHLLLFMFSHGSCQSNKLLGEGEDVHHQRVSTMEQSDNAHIEMVVNHDRKHNQHDHPMSHMKHDHRDHMMDDPLVVVFFTVGDLKVGNTMPIHFPKRDPSSSPHFLPRKEAESLPFTSQEIPFLRRFFSFSPQSPQAVAMENTLKDCERKRAIGETKLCCTSLESMLEFASDNLGLDVSNIRGVSTIHLTKSDVLFQNFTIMDFSEYYVSSKLVSCHSMPYPYAVFFCHYMANENKAFKVSLMGRENGDRVEAVAVCHMDTSNWSETLVAFQVLGTKPGSSVCHFFPADHLVWIPSSPALI